MWFLWYDVQDAMNNMNDALYELSHALEQRAGLAAAPSARRESLRP